VKAFVTSGVSASLPGRCEDAMDLIFEEMKRVKVLGFSNSEEREERLYCSLLGERESNFSRKGMQESYLYGLTSSLPLQILKRKRGSNTRVLILRKGSNLPSNTCEAV